jgi:hypothetical protein
VSTGKTELLAPATPWNIDRPSAQRNLANLFNVLANCALIGWLSTSVVGTTQLEQKYVPKVD